MIVPRRNWRWHESMEFTAATLFERRKADRGQFSETTLAFAARRIRETIRILCTISRTYVQTHGCWRENVRPFSMR